MKKQIAFILAAAMIFFAMSGCAIQKNIYKDDPELAEEVLHPSSSPSTETDGDSSETTSAHDYAAAFATYDPDMVVATVDGIDVTWRAYFYWCKSALANVETYTGTITDFDEDFSGMSYGDVIKAAAENNCLQFCSIDYHTQKEGITLSDESVAALEDQLQTEIKSYSTDGTEEGFNDFLESQYISRDMYDYISRIAMLYSDGYKYYCGENGEKITDKEALEYGENSGLMVAKHILLKTTDDDDNALSDEEKAEKLELAQEIIDRINNGEDFDTLMAEYNEDTGEAYYPDGYCFSDGQMLTEFEDAVKALGPGEMTPEPVESSYGYHIILRGELKPDSEVYSQSSSATVRQLAAADKYNSIVNGWFEDSELNYVDGINVDFNQIFNGK
ncbi:MAG: peptidylprolyl isomerase [Oscillospiraceae bacterium]